MWLKVLYCLAKFNKLLSMTQIPAPRVPSAFEQAIRNFALRLPYNRFGKKVASILLRLAGGGRPSAFEVAVFGTQKAHLHPFDNISEKRVYITPHFWEPAERTRLAALIKAHKGEELTFLDVGGNAGLYTLYVQSLCLARNLRLRAVAVEPDPTMRARLEKNFSLSNIKALILPWAISDVQGELTLNLNQKNRGQNSIEEGFSDGEGLGITVPTQKFEDILIKAGIETPDILKIDIEGAEYRALKVFFEEADQARWPRYMQIEGSPEDRNPEAIQLCLKHGYELLDTTGHNSMLKMP